MLTMANKVARYRMRVLDHDYGWVFLAQEMNCKGLHSFFGICNQDEQPSEFWRFDGSTARFFTLGSCSGHETFDFFPRNYVFKVFEKQVQDTQHRISLPHFQLEVCQKPIILIVEDDERELKRYQAELGGSYEIWTAVSVAEARWIFDGFWQNLAAIVVDGSLSLASHYDTGPLVHYFRKSGFNRSIIAASSVWNRELVGDGCDLDSSKAKLSTIIRSLMLHV